MKDEYFKEIKKIDKQISKLQDKRNSIKKELLDYRISTSDYIAGDELIPLRNSMIDIEVILDSNLEEVYIPRNEGVYVRNGRLDCSSFNEGILYYSNTDNSYIHCYHGCEENLDIKYIFLRD